MIEIGEPITDPMVPPPFSTWALARQYHVLPLDPGRLVGTGSRPRAGAAARRPFTGAEGPTVERPGAEGPAAEGPMAEGPASPESSPAYSSSSYSCS